VVLLVFLFLVIGAALVVFFLVGTLFLQGYLYTEPAEQLSWRAPAAGAALMMFFGLLCVSEANIDPTRTPKRNPLYPLIYSPDEDMSPKEVQYLWAVRRVGRDKTEEVKYELKKYNIGPMQRTEYVQAAAREKHWNSAGVEAILIEVDGQKDRFMAPKKTPEGSYRRFVDADGWSMAEYDSGPTGKPERFRLDWFLGNLLLNLFHLGLWFACLWVLLRFQWPHALGLAVPLWLVVSLTVLPILLTQARSLAGPAPRQKTAALSLTCPPPSFV
jgi:hypothetical protein